MPVLGILTKAYVGDIEKLRKPLLRFPQSRLDNPVLLPCAAPTGILFLWDAEQKYTGHASLFERFQLP